MKEITVDVKGVHSQKKTNEFIKNFENLLKYISENKNLKINVVVQVYCADCNRKFNTFIGLRKHMKITGHKDRQ